MDEVSLITHVTPLPPGWRVAVIFEDSLDDEAEVLVEWTLVAIVTRADQRHDFLAMLGGDLRELDPLVESLSAVKARAAKVIPPGESSVTLLGVQREREAQLDRAIRGLGGSSMRTEMSEDD